MRTLAETMGKTNRSQRETETERQTNIAERERELAEGTVESRENRYVLPDRSFYLSTDESDQ